MSIPEDWPEALQLPPLAPVELTTPLSSAGRAAIEEFAAGINAWLAGLPAPVRANVPIDPLTAGDVDYLADAVTNLVYNNGEFWSPLSRESVPWNEPLPFTPSIEWLEPIQFVRILLLTGHVDARGITYRALEALQRYRKVRSKEFGLREFGATLSALGLAPAVIAEEFLDGFFPQLRWGPAATWPYFLEHLPLLETALSERRGRPVVPDVRCAHCRVNAFDALACFPRIPPPLEDSLWRIALGSSKTFRLRAQRLLDKEPASFQRIISSLASRKAGERMAAAVWLAERPEGSGEAALREALQKESDDSVRHALVTALERLGIKLDAIIDVDAIAREADSAIGKRGIARELSWVPFDRLPRMHWRGTGKAVTPQTAAWWMAQAFKLKSPDPSALLARQLSLVEARERESFGAAVLQAWIDFDTMPHTPESALKAAEHHLEEHRRIYEYLKKLGEPPMEMPSLAELAAEFAHLPGGSAISSKGVLAVPAACGGVETVRLAVAYIQKWYGLRAAQGKALICMIAWIEHPEAVQFLTATSKRFRTTGIRNGAFQALQALAERKGWTVDELADRMIPDAGLDADGRMVLDFGGRSFTAAIDPDFKLRLRDTDGGWRDSLPKPASNDDETRSAEARQLFSTGKKQIRAIDKEQTDRLFAAMCSGRRWTFDLWRDALAAHPVAGLLCRRLVWREETADDSRLFRPRGGGEFVGASGETIDLRGEVSISLAHDDNTPPEHALPWMAHFEEYGLDFLFPQFNRGLPELRADSLEATAIADFEGYTIRGFQLRNAVRKLGYLRGSALDGLQFYEYFKPYAALRLEVKLEFSGNEMPERDVPVAVQRMSFHRLPDPGQPSCGPLQLAEVPRVLLLESFRDLREIAEGGGGYDAQWRKKVWPAE